MTAQQLYEKLKNVKLGSSVCQYSLKKCEELVPLINEINELKEEKNAVILAHSYISPEIIYGVSDFVGDSYKLSRDALATSASTIVFVAVRFMGETAKILNPEKEVLVPAVMDGCSLADSIDAQTVRDLRRRYPQHTFLCYVNTRADVKAECDVTVTSANVYKVAQNVPNDKIYFLPDKFMGQNLKNHMERQGSKKDIQFYSGTCYVHEEYGMDDILKIRLEYPEAKIVSHPECNSTIIDNSDFVGSTEQMLGFMRQTASKQFLMLTECGLSARLQSEFPDKQLVGSCTMCKFMKSNTLGDILRALKAPVERDRVLLDEAIRRRALKTIEAMFLYAEK
ncbi:MAG: quinolinate synthase NadA [Candidatus Omnitrophica bacterium]|nr:quinolinate synthase NadA [Candidatus Omnitrophota bacterium]MDE2009689.1 quinolinate synthase NadA [Candidatus Omnitrophota bacterium]MDE2213914.1 quinolinate synthase NadA [Candidatus Omnitrophota bacterium]MDE2231827.1 quinolinate synthase NadA [Candidatus Omnitrophota bacterium]